MGCLTLALPPGGVDYSKWDAILASMTDSDGDEDGAAEGPRGELKARGGAQLGPAAGFKRSNEAPLPPRMQHLPLCMLGVPPTPLRLHTATWWSVVASLALAPTTTLLPVVALAPTLPVSGPLPLCRNACSSSPDPSSPALP